MLSKKKTMTKNETLSERIKKIKIEDYFSILKEIKKNIEVSRATWSNWKNGKTEPNYSDGKIIDEILTKYGY
jgi:transcriptional regulator with XRE-family HTH domain